MHGIMITLLESPVTKNLLVSVRQGEILKNREIHVPFKDVNSYATSDEIDVGGKGLTGIKINYLSYKNSKVKRIITTVIFKNGILQTVL